MPKFFEEPFSPSHPVLTGENARHIGFALRMRVGESLTVCAGGQDYTCQIAAITGESVTLTVLHAAPCAAEPSVSVTLFQALPKAEKLEQIVQKAVELGVTAIVPVLTRRCVARPTPSDFEKKRARLQKIAQQAAMQSGRGMIPTISPLQTLADCADALADCACKFVLYEAKGGQSFATLPTQAPSYGMLVGSEGGFDAAEIADLTRQGVVPIWLGERILRCETAPLAALSVLMYHTGNFS